MTPAFEVSISQFYGRKVAVLSFFDEESKLPQALETFIAWRKANYASPDEFRTFNIIYPSDKAANKLRIDVCCEYPDGLVIEPPMTAKVLESMQCACITGLLSEQEINDGVNFILDSWLDTVGLAPFGKKLIFERHINSYSSRHYVDAYVPIQFKTP